MTTTAEIRKQNEELAKKINEEAIQDPRSPYAGKFVGLANGKVVVVADSLKELARCLENAEPDPQRTFWIEASRDYTQVEYVWGLR
jgi:hypothetical protein